MLSIVGAVVPMALVIWTQLGVVVTYYFLPFPLFLFVCIFMALELIDSVQRLRLQEVPGDSRWFQELGERNTNYVGNLLNRYQCELILTHWSVRVLTH